MNRANYFVQQHLDNAQNFLDGVTAISEAAEDADEDGRWGVDGWIRLIHDTIDLQIRTTAELIETAIEEPFWWLGMSNDEPYAIDSVRAKKAKPYARRYDIVKTFHRAGDEATELPDGLLKFDPPILPAGQVRFRVLINDIELEIDDVVYRGSDFYGANYIGAIRLLPVDPAFVDEKRKAHPQEFTVGL